MRKRASYVFLSVTIGLLTVSSCTKYDTYDILKIENEKVPTTWREELKMLVNDNSSVLTASGVSLKKARKLSSVTPDSASFFNDEMRFYPIYQSDLKKFDVAPYRFLQEDTVTVHYRTTHLNSMVNEILSSNVPYDVVELTWEKDGESFKTLSLFNEETGELLYDNIFSNIITQKIVSGSKKPFLTRSEGGPGYSPYQQGYEIVYYMPANGDGYTYAAINWYELGYNEQINVTDSTGNIIGHRIRYHHVRCDYTPHTYSTNGTESKCGFLDMSANYDGEFMFYIWAGPGFPGENYLYTRLVMDNTNSEYINMPVEGSSVDAHGYVAHYLFSTER